MRLPILLSALLVASACAGSPDPATPTPVSGPTASQAATFSLVQGGNPVVTERFARGPERLESEMHLPDGSRLLYTALLRPDATVSEIDLRQLPAGTPAGPPTFHSTVAFRGDSVMVTSARGGVEPVRQPAAPGSIPYVNPSPVLMEQIVRRARAMGGETAAVPVWVPNEGGQTLTANVAFTAPDSARLEMAGTEIVLRLGADGSILGGSVPAQGVVIERAVTVEP